MICDKCIKKGNCDAEMSCRRIKKQRPFGINTVKCTGFVGAINYKELYEKYGKDAHCVVRQMREEHQRSRAEHIHEPYEKPPIGIKPRWLVDESRLIGILKAIERYIEARKPIPIEWIEEYNDLIKSKV